MTPTVPVPELPDRDAAREWMRQIRNALPHEARETSTTPEEFADVQRRRLLDAAGEHADAGVRRRIEVALTGDVTADHSVPVSTLGPFLSNLQESISAVAQALAGRPTSVAAIPREIREATTLSAVATFPSSFGVAMYGPSTDVEESGLLADWVGEFRTILDEAVERVLDIVDLSEGASLSDELLTERLAPLGPRSMKHIGALTAGLNSAGVGMRVAWYAQGRQARRSDWSTSGVQRVRYLCEHSEFAEAQRVTVAGLLGSASAFRSKVEIRTEDGEIIQASTGEELTGHLERHFNKRVEADIEVTKVRFSGGRERTINNILALRNI
ncbi:hypothetical protein [Actinoplanes palleronii]|uniref:PH domain-containing protein n=1 Tax=Actinoplanes palleronii TaxID=113570 RepID=A0ABQ4BMH9_9ACTN|nr:hypothetical protein [Actinoplanes palleronii]GIE71881.1 hypothetical protein Apa02nite_079890 [Actinoplanes palleronii]